MTIHYYLNSFDTEFVKKILPDFYVDNLVTGVNTAEEGIALYSKVKMLFKKASMEFRN